MRVQWRWPTLVLILAVLPLTALGQTPRTPEELAADVAAGARANRERGRVPLPAVDPAASRDWPLHNFDLFNSRYAPLDQINTSNVSSLAVRWLYHTASGRATPVVAGGVMYVTSPDSVAALDAATGRPVWAQHRGRWLARRRLWRGEGVRRGRHPRDGARRPDRGVRSRIRRGRRVQRAHRGAAGPLSGTGGTDRVGLSLQHGAAVPRRRAHRRHGAQREPHPGAACCSPSTPAPASCSGSSSPFRRVPRTRGGR